MSQATIPSAEAGATAQAALIGYRWGPTYTFDRSEGGRLVARWTGFEILYDAQGRQVFSGSGEGFGTGGAVQRAAPPPDYPPPTEREHKARARRARKERRLPW